MPPRYRQVKAVLRAMGLQVEERSAKGSHVVITDGKGRTYTIPAHRGDNTELSDPYLRGVCRAFDLDYKAFRKKV